MEQKRWRHIDAIRGLAALCVVYYHAAERVWVRGAPAWQSESFVLLLARDWIDLGKIAVILFFAVSGFVIPFSLMKSGPHPIPRFLIGRFFRLYPAYWLSMAVGLLVLFPLEGRTATPGMVLANLTMIQKVLGASHIIELYWTLQIELFFYLVCIALFWLRLLQNHRAVCAVSLLCAGAALAAAAVKFFTGHYLPVALPLSLSVMFWGLSWRYRISGSHPQDRQLSTRLTLLLVCLLPLICGLGYHEGPSPGHESLRYTITYTIALSAFMALTTRVKLVHPVLDHLGKISYSVYLFAPIWQIAMETAGRDMIGRLIPFHLFIAMLMAVSVLMADRIYRLVEKPAQQFGRRMAARLD